MICQRNNKYHDCNKQLQFRTDEEEINILTFLTFCRGPPPSAIVEITI